MRDRLNDDAIDDIRDDIDENDDDMMSAGGGSIESEDRVKSCLDQDLS